MALTQLFVLPPFFLSGALYPLNGLPAWPTVLTRADPLTYIVDPMRHAVFDHLAVSPLARNALSPGVTWDGWLVPLALSLAMVAAMGLAMLMHSHSRVPQDRITPSHCIQCRHSNH